MKLENVVRFSAEFDPDWWWVPPPHCFEHSYVSAFGHVIRDTLVVATFALLAASLLKTHNLSAVDYLGWHLHQGGAEPDA